MTHAKPIQTEIVFAWAFGYTVVNTHYWIIQNIANGNNRMIKTGATIIMIAIKQITRYSTIRKYAIATPRYITKPKKANGNMIIERTESVEIE